MIPRLLRWLVGAAVVAAVFSPAAAPASGARTLVITGRAADAERAAIRGARISVGSRARPVAITDVTGRYSISLFIGSFAGLVQAPYHETFRASCKGWNLSPTAGVSALALEISVVQARDGAARLRVQSNDPAFADSVAHALVAPGSAAAMITVDFLGRRGTELASGAIPLTATTELALPSSDAPPGMGLPPFVGRPITADSERTTAANVPASDATTPSGGRVRTTTAPESNGAAASSRTPPRERAWRLFPSAEELLADRPSHGDSTPAPAARPVVPSSTANAPPVPRVSGTSTRTPPVDTTATRKASVSPPAQPAPPVAERVTRVVPPASVAPGIDTSKPARKTEPARETKPAIAVSVAPNAPSTGSDDSSDPPEYSGAIRVWGGRTVPRPVTRPANDGTAPCTCRIKGTVEVRGNRPLAEHVKIVVFVADLPAIRDTVDLFMGPPREFDLHEVPCGPRRIQVQALSRRRFAPASNVPLEEVPCGSGRVRELHLVLEPR